MNFEFEVELNYQKGRTIAYNQVVFGADQNLDSFYHFSFIAPMFRIDDFTIGKAIRKKDSSIYEKLHESTISEPLDSRIDGSMLHAYNKLTIRKIESIYYFFFREKFAHQMEINDLYGEYFGVSIGNFTTSRIGSISFMQINL